MFSNKYFPPQYFADRYFGATTEAGDGFIAGQAVASSSVAATLSGRGRLAGSAIASSTSVATLGAQSAAAFISGHSEAGAYAEATLSFTGRRRGGAGVAQHIEVSSRQSIDDEDWLVLQFVTAFLAQSHGVHEWDR